ncbi:hypothetical protein F2Q69_00003042 [Brassica cretica]|uniref:Uncharacterized protein n=1 Tax=Brassica cretica TaxID=69181 RepID=A0A8S9NU64_BRACR|nr:hypothetical protein F2Q69_00003042 [Brassica cretica]
MPFSEPFYSDPMTTLGSSALIKTAQRQSQDGSTNGGTGSDQQIQSTPKKYSRPPTHSTRNMYLINQLGL